MDCFYAIYDKEDSEEKMFQRGSKAFAITETAFVQAPNNNKFEEHIKGDKGNCVKYRKLSTVKMNVRSTFWAGDPIKFMGTAIGEVNLNGDVTGRFLKIKVWQLPDTYVYVYINGDDKLALRQKVLKK